jgi:hypothetical protein
VPHLRKPLETGWTTTAHPEADRASARRSIPTRIMMRQPPVRSLLVQAPQVRVGVTAAVCSVGQKPPAPPPLEASSGDPLPHHRLITVIPLAFGLRLVAIGPLNSD